MIIRTKAPLRLGLAGGGSDVSPYSDMFGGYVLNATINLSAYCTIEETGDGLISIDSYDSGVHCSYPSSASLPVDGNADLVKGVYNRVIKDFGPDGQGGSFEGFFGVRPGVNGFRISTYNDAPAGSGLGTSSTMVVCILKCFAEWLSLPLGDYEIARLAYSIEREDLSLAGGKQDQYAAAFGGFNFMEFRRDGAVIVNPLKIKRWIVDELECSMVLYYTGKSRSSAAIIGEQQKNTSSGNKVAIEAMHRIRQSSEDMKVALLKGDMAEFARLLGMAWDEKKKMAMAITNPVIQEAFDTAMAAGALAGKVSGAGGGGFIMLMVPPVKKKDVIDALSTLPGQVVPFQFTDRGAHAWKIYETDRVDKM